MRIWIIAAIMLSSFITTAQKHIDPSPILGSIKETSAPVKMILADPQVHVRQGEEFTTEYWVISFQLTILDHDGEVLADRSDSDGKALSSYQKKLIAKLKPGSRLIFERIKAITHTKKSGLLPHFTIDIR
jgi:hypothetical protein